MKYSPAARRKISQQETIRGSTDSNISDEKFMLMEIAVTLYLVIAFACGQKWSLHFIRFMMYLIDILNCSGPYWTNDPAFSWTIFITSMICKAWIYMKTLPVWSTSSKLMDILIIFIHSLDPECKYRIWKMGPSQQRWNDYLKQYCSVGMKNGHKMRFMTDSAFILQVTS